MDTNQPPSPATAVILQRAHEQSGHGGGWSLCMGSATWTSPHQGRPGCSQCQVPNRPTAETNTESWTWHPSPAWQVDYIGPLPSWKGQGFLIIGLDIYFGCRSAYPTCNASAKTTIHGLTECVFHHHGISHNIASNQGTHFTANEV